jgi:hypothetical protein
MGDISHVKLLRGLGLATVTITLVHLFTLGSFGVWGNLSVYRLPAVEVAAFMTLTAVVLTTGVFYLRERPFGRTRWVLLAILAVTAAAALVGMPPPSLISLAEWSFGVVCWTGLLLLLDLPFPVVVAFLAGHLVSRLAVLAAVGELDHPELADGLIFAAVFLACQLVVAAAAMLLRRMAVITAEANREEERLSTAEAVAEQVHRDRQERFVGLDTVPLLAELAAGVLDPADEGVRVRCAVDAARMRRLFAESDAVPDRLVHELRACLDTAERKGISVYLATCGARPEPPLAVRRALTEPVLALLATAASTARITVIGSPTTVTVGVVTDGQPLSDLTPMIDEVTVTQLTHGGRNWVEATWRTVA